MSGFFGGGSAGSYLLASTPLGEEITETTVLQNVFTFQLGGQPAAGRVLRIRAQFRFDTDDAENRYVAYGLSTEDGALFAGFDTRTGDGDGITDGAWIMDINVLPFSITADGGFTLALLQPILVQSGEGVFERVASVKNSYSGEDPADFTTLHVTAQLSDDDDDGLRTTLEYAYAEILRAP